MVLATRETRREFRASNWTQTSDEAVPVYVVPQLEQVRASPSVALGSMDLRRIDRY